MKKTKLLLLPLSFLLLTSCIQVQVEPNTHTDPVVDPDDPPVDPEDPPVNPDDPPVNPDDPPVDPEDPPVVDPETPQSVTEPRSIQDMTILQVWNWKLNDIKSRLKQIKQMGYGAIQTSPLQPNVDKDYGQYGTTKDVWWKLYQPLAFKVAESGENMVGNRDQLISLCNEADKYGLKVIVDVVCNHLAGSASGYNNQVYKRYPLHTYQGKADDDNQQSVVQGNIGLPDLDTSNKELQQDVLTMLKDYVSCGVDGFRFDAAKHIETPDDGAYASDFWPTVLNGTTEYALANGYAKPYYYGEILTTCGKNRDYSSYTKYMSVTESKQGDAMVLASATNNVAKADYFYNTGDDPTKMMLWGETHDTYANGKDTVEETTRLYDKKITNKAYLIQASRKDAASLYFARPTSLNVSLGSIDNNSGWKDETVKAINKFHNRYIDKEESISLNNASNGCFINVRGKGSFAGAAIIDISGYAPKKVNVKGLADGQYIDLVSKNEFTVSNEQVAVTFTEGSCILIPKAAYVPDEEIDDEYNSSVVIKDADKTKSYYVWTWGNGHSDEFRAFVTDKDAIGVTLSNNDPYIIVEFPGGTTQPQWSNALRQTYDLKYNGNQTIYEYKDIVWKSN